MCEELLYDLFCSSESFLPEMSMCPLYGNAGYTAVIHYDVIDKLGNEILDRFAKMGFPQLIPMIEMSSIMNTVLCG